MRLTHRPLILGLFAFLPACSSSNGSLTCGDGTEQSGDSCVPTHGALPSVTSVSLSSLSMDVEGQSPVYVAYPTHASVTLQLQGDAFDSMVVLGLESADGKTGCYLGKLDVSYQPSSTPGASAVSVGGDVFVQPECAALAGQKDVRTWVSFDPFGAVDLAGRPAPTADASALTDLVGYFKQTILSLTGCHGSDPGPHPTTCVTALDVEASPGLDVALDEALLDSAVASVPVLDAPSAAPDPTTLGPEYDGVTFGQPPPTADLAGRLPSTPQFHVNAAVLLRGAMTAPGKKALDPNQMGVQFALRPDPTHVPADFAPEKLAWVPLSIEEQTVTSDVGKDGPVISIARVQQQFLAGLSATERYQKESPVFIDGAALDLVRSLEGSVEQYELQVCVTAMFKEQSPDPDPSANNCQILPVAVLVDHRGSDGVSTLSAGAPGGASLDWSKSYSFTSGSKHNIRVASFLGTDNGCNTFECYSNTGAWMRFDGKYVPSFITDSDGNFFIFDFFANGQVFLSDTGPRTLQTSLTIANINVYSHMPNLDNGVTVKLPTLSYSDDITLFEAKACVPDVDFPCVYFSATVSPTLSLDTSVEFKENVPVPGCAGGATATNGHCFIASGTKETYEGARASCVGLGGYLAEIGSADENKAAMKALQMKNVTQGWVGAHRLQADCSPAGAGTSDPFILATCGIVNSESAWYWQATGSVSSGYEDWAAGQPYDTTFSTGAVIGATEGTWSSFSELSNMPFVCEIVTSYDFIGTVTPGLSFPLTFDVSGGLKGVATVGGELAVDPLEINFPNTVDLNASFESLSPLKVRGSLDFTSKVTLSGLDGSLSVNASVGPASYSYDLVSWDGVPYGSYTLGNLSTGALVY